MSGKPVESTRVRELLEWPLVEDELRGRCATGGGRRLASALGPLDATRARARMKKISALKELAARGERPDFTGVVDIEETLALAEKGASLSLPDLFALRGFTGASDRVARFLRAASEEFPSLGPEYRALDPLAEIGALLRESITDTGEINDGRFPALARLRADLAAARTEIEKRLGALVRAPGMARAVQEKTWSSRNERYVILVKSSHRHAVPGTVHDLSSSGSTCYVEPEEIIPLNNRALLAERDIRAEILRILASLSAAVRERVPALLGNYETVTGLDFLSAGARLSADITGAEPALDDGAVLDLREARHPLLALMTPGRVVANDVRLTGERRCMIISGANTGGKTVLLKTAGLCALMASFGLHVPASPDSRLGIFRRIMADMGDDQSLSRSLSSFSGQIVEISGMISAAGPDSLVIVDEIVTGTDPRQGAALARAILEGLADRGAFVIAATHYGELKELSAADGRFRNASVSFDTDALTPTYRLIDGLPGASHALETARRYGLPEHIVGRAQELLDLGGTTVEAMVENLRAREQDLAERERRALEDRRALEAKAAALEAKESRLARESQEIGRKEGIALLETLERHRRAVAERVASLQGAGLREAGEIQRELITREEAVRDALRKGDASRYAGRYAPARKEAIVEGDRVFIPSLECEGTVEALDDGRGTARVLIGGSIRSSFSLGDLMKASGARPATGGPVKKKKDRGTSAADDDRDEPVGVTIQTAFNTIDLRGMRADEALSTMESSLDRMSRSGIAAAIVIHGHGTGALKQAVRDRLKSSPYSADFRPGENGEGGDGVTVVRLKL